MATEMEVDEPPRFEHIFETEIIPEFERMDDFLEFARIETGLNLKEGDIQDILHDYNNRAREQRYQMLWKWVEKSGSAASPARIQELVRDFWERQANEDVPDGSGYDATDSAPGLDVSMRVSGEAQPQNLAQPLGGAGELPRCHPPTSIKQYQRPRPAFQKTKGYSNTLNAVKSGDSVIHVHGMSGNGKSQIVRAVCQELCASESDRLIWHIQGSETDFLQNELIKFTKKLKKCRHISDDQMTAALKGIDDGNIQQFLTLVKRLKSAVLLVIEDISSDNDRELMRNLIQVLSSNEVNSDKISKPDNTGSIFQILIATRKADIIFSDLDLAELSTYRLVKISGFTEEEAVKFLLSSNHGVGEEEVLDLAKILAYSPLRLTLAKAYCKKYHTPFKSYYDSLGTNKTIIAKEKELLEAHSDLGKSHGYEVIMRAVGPNMEKEEDKLQFAVIQMMSFIAHDDIPDILVGRFFQQQKATEMSVEEQNVKYLLSRLETDCDLTIHEIKGAEDGSKVKYGEGLSSIHQDVLDCVRLDMDDKTKMTVLVSVLHAMVSLVKKDNRLHQASNLLCTLMKHIDKVVSFASKLLKTNFSIEKPRQFDFEIQICLSWLYDALGFSLTIYAETKDRVFDRALEYLWSIACSYSDGKLFFCFPKKLQKDLLDYEPGKSPAKTAEKVYKRVKKASEKIPERFIEDHYAKFFPLDKHLIDEMHKKLGENTKINWEEIDNELQKNRNLTSEQITTLRKNGLLLTPKQLRKVFLSERIASVLHSRGRQVIQLKDEIPFEEQKRYEWYSELGLQLTKVMGDDTGIKTTYEYIIEANNKLPRMLHAQENESDDDFIKRLKAAKQIAERLKTAEGVYFEHGVCKEMSGTPYSLLNAMKYVVKANTKMLKRRHLVANHPNCPTNPDQDLKDCDELFDLAKKNAQNFVMASACMVQAGKYYAAVKKFEKALEAFEASFEHDGTGINHHLQKRPNLYAWAVYNIARAVHEGGSDTPNGNSCRERLLKRHDLVVKEKVSNTWKELLEKYKEKVNAIEFVEPVTVIPLE